MTTTAEPLAYSAKKAAEAAGVSLDTILRAIRRGDLRAKRSGQLDDGTPTGKYLIPRAALADWLEALPDA